MMDKALLRIETQVEMMKAKLRGHTVFPFEGNDERMWVERSLQSANALLMYTSIDDKNTIRGNALYDDIKGRVKQYIEKGGPKGICRARFYEPYDRLYTYSEDSVDAIVDQLVLRRTEHMDDKALSELIVSFPARWVVYDNSYATVISHQFADGCMFSELVSVPMDGSTIDWNMVPEFAYTPGITELVGIGSGIGKIPLSLIHAKRNLQLSSNWKTPVTEYMPNPNATVARIKRIKQYVEESHGKIPFTYLLACISSWNIMRCTDKNELTVAVSFGFKQPPNPSSHRFNSFSASIMRIERPPEFDSMDITTQFMSITSQVVGYIPGTISQITGAYLLTNVYNMNIMYTSFVDVIVANGATTLPMKYHGVDCTLNRCYLIGSSAPVYGGRQMMT